MSHGIPAERRHHDSPAWRRNQSRQPAYQPSNFADALGVSLKKIITTLRPLREFIILVGGQ
jgi:hypothetical protein